MYFHQANETQDPSDMSDPSEVNQPHPVFVVQGPGRYIQVPYYVPVHTPQLYPNYTVDPNQQHWFHPPQYGNTPILNGRQSENDGADSESNVDDERSSTASFPPPGVGLPAASTMQQHHLYQMVPPFSYVGSLPSGVSVQGYVNSPIPYPTPYAGIATGAEPNTQQNSNRGGRGGKGGSGAKISSDKQGGGNDSSYNAAPQLTPQDSNAGNDPSTPTLPPSSMPIAPPPPHPQPGLVPFGGMHYGYPYFSPTGPPHPPPHITSAQHATGSPIYIPHPPGMPVYHTPIYNSAPTAVFSTDNGMPHSAVTVPVSVAPPPSEIVANHETDSTSTFNVKENSNEEPYKNSTLMADSAPFEPENQKNGNFVQEDHRQSNVNEVTVENSTLPDGANEVPVNDIAPRAAENEHHADDDKFQIVDGVAPVNDNVNAIEQSAIVVDKINEKSKQNADNVAALINDLRVTNKDECTGHDVKETNASPEINDKSGIAENLSITSETDSKSTETTWNDMKTINENVNGKTTSSPDTSTSSGFDLSATKSTTSSEAKSEIVEEHPPIQGSCKKSWASLFKESSSSTKSKPTVGVARTVPGEQINSHVSVVSNQHVENVSSKSSSGNSSLNGMSSISSSQSNKAQNYKLSSPSLADDTMLPKIGELLKNYKLDHRAVNIEPRGLENRSNYCYINAILQALLACPPFYNLMKSISHNLHHKTKLATKQHFPIIDSMVQFVEEFKLVPQKARRDKARKLDTAPQEIIPGKPFEPSYMYNMLSVIQSNSSFTMGQQEDAQEFLTCLLNGLNDEMVELIQLAEGTNNGINARKNPQATKAAASKNNKKISNGDISADVIGPDDSDSEWKQVQSKIKPHRPNLALTRTPLSEIFRGQMRSRLQKIGDQCTNSIEPFFTLHLNIEKANSVKEALELLVGRDAVEGVTSSRTNQEVDAWQQQTLEELPYVLLLHLKYFDYKHHTCTKIKRSIEFPIDLKLDIKLISSQSALRSKMALSKSRQYKLFAVVYHDGNEATKGHYITDVFHIGYGGWVRYDDARVCTVSENDVLKPDLPRVPYLLYYRRCDTIAALMQPPFEKRM